MSVDVFRREMARQGQLVRGLYRLLIGTPILLPVLIAAATTLGQGTAKAAATTMSKGAAVTTVTQFRGELSEAASGENSILRKFEVLLVSSPTGHFFSVLDDARDGCAWPDSFGLAGTAEDASSVVQPHILYSYNDNLYSIVLPSLAVEFPSQIDLDTTWESGGWKLTVMEKRSLDGVSCWMIEARERRGRRQILFADTETGILVRAQADVFMGQGDQFRLVLARTSTNEVDTSRAEKLTNLQQRLLALRKAMNRRPDSQLAELSARQLALVSSEQPELHQMAEGTVLQELVLRLSTDTSRQQQRLAATQNRAGQLMNSAAPSFSLNLVGGGTLQSSDLQGKIVVLHFWDYRDQPLTEPYGQTGYLDFIYNQRRKLNVQVVGVATNADLLTAENINRGRRSARKLAEFMNLTYPISYDDGSLLRSLGDPREANGQLPLWVVLSADGKIAHYHAGYYEIDAARGLQQLDEVLIRLLGK